VVVAAAAAGIVIIQYVLRVYFYLYCLRSGWNYTQYCVSSALCDASIKKADANELAVKALELSQNNPQQKFYFCVDKNCGRLRWLAENRLRPLGYPIDWCVEAMSQTRRSPVTTTINNYNSDDDDDSEDDDDEDTSSQDENWEAQWIARAADWLVRNDALHD
jgi:hypothetical protein